MKEDVSVIVADHAIYVDGVSIECQFKPHKKNLWAVQWHNGRCGLEFNVDGEMSNSSGTYETDVAPYVEIWEKANALIQEIEDDSPGNQ